MFNQYQPAVQPIAPYMAQPAPQYQPKYQYQPPSGLSGRTVASLSEVTVNDVPSDGSTGFFPAADGSVVWAKRWMSDGSISTTAYVPEPVPEPAPEPDKMDAVLERLSAIEAALKGKAKRKAVDDE